MWTPPSSSSSSSLCKPPKYVGLVQCGHLLQRCPHCTRPTDLCGLHSDDDDGDDEGVHIVLDQQTWVVYIVMMMMIMTEVSTLY
jgi:hypothetical protein